MKTQIRERLVEKHLVTLCTRYGCLTYKFTSPGHAGVPDRLVILPGGETVYIEVKRPGGKTTPLQDRHLRILREQGCRCYVVDSYEACDRVMEVLCES